MAPGNNERQPGHTGTIPKTKIRNNCNVPQEAVTPTRRDMASNLVTTSLDWVPVSEYNTRTNYNQSRKPTNNSSEHDLTELDNSVSFESGFGRFVPVRPQPRVLPLNVQNRDHITTNHNDDGAGSSISSHTLHSYAHQMQNGLIPHTNHTAAAVMIVNPTTPNTCTGSISQPFNASNRNRNNLTRNINSARNNFEGSNHTSNNNTPSSSNSRSGTKTVNLINNMYDQIQGSLNNINENEQVHRESARALGEAIVAACPDAAAVERRLGQIREYIRVTSSLVDTMRNSEDEAFIEHTKEEYDDLVAMVMQLKESEKKLEKILIEKGPENLEVPEKLSDESVDGDKHTLENDFAQEKPCNIKANNDACCFNNINLKKVANVENNPSNFDLAPNNGEVNAVRQDVCLGVTLSDVCDQTDSAQSESNIGNTTQEELNNLNIQEIESISCTEDKKDDMNEILRKNILSCVEKVALIEEMKNKEKDNNGNVKQDVVVRPASVQSNGSAYSENELWQNEIKNKMELSQLRLAALKQQQKRLLKYQEEAKQQLEEINRERQSQEMQTSTSHDNLNQPFGGSYSQANRMYAANQIGVATTLPHSADVMAGQQAIAMANNVDGEHEHSANATLLQDERFSHRDANAASGEEAVGGGPDSEAEDEEVLSEQGRMLQLKLRELQLKKQHMENLVSEFQKLQMATRLDSSHNTYSTSGEESGEDEASRKCNKTMSQIKNDDPFKLLEIKAIKTALQKTKDLMRSVETYEADNMSSVPDDSYQMPRHSNIHDNKSDCGGSMGGWSNEGSLCRVRNSLPQRPKFTNEQHSQHHQQQLHHQQMQQQLHQQQQQQQLHQQQQQQQLHQQQQQQQLQQQQQQQQQLHQQQQQLHQQQQIQQQHQQHHQQPQQQPSHEANIASLQELAQELRMETEKIMNERQRIKDVVSNKEGSRKKKVNEEVHAGPSSRAAGATSGGGSGGGGGSARAGSAPGAGGGPGPAERRQLQLRALLADKQRELEALLNKEEIICSEPEVPQIKQESREASVLNQSYNSEQEEPDSRSEPILMDSHNMRESDNFRAGGDNSLGPRSVNTIPSHLDSTYGSDSDSTSRTKSNQRNRPRRRQAPDRLSDDNNVQPTNNANNQNVPSIVEPANINMVPPTLQNNENGGNLPYLHGQPPSWSKSNQDIRSNQFTQNSHSQTMDRLLGTPQMSYPPSLPFNMMMPYGMGMGGCGCGCGFWGAWCWQQLVMQQREIHQLREQLSHLEERWRADTASHTLNNQVPPGNRANNYWDNFRSYSRQNLLSANSKTNADGHLGVGPTHNPTPLVERSHNTLHHTSSTPPTNTPKRNTNAVTSSMSASSQPTAPNVDDLSVRHPRRNNAYERSLSFSSAPDVLNINQKADSDASGPSHPRNVDDASANVSNVNINRQEPHPQRNLNITNPIPEIIQSHSNNLNSSANSKKKSSTKLPAKNSSQRRNQPLEYTSMTNINIASTSEAPNPNLASTSREVHDKASSKVFDLLRENVYSEVTTLIGVNESHPDFLIQLFRELQLISSDPLRQKVLQSIRNVLSQYSTIIESQGAQEETRTETAADPAAEASNYHECNSLSGANACASPVQVDHSIVHFLLQRCDDIFTADLLETLTLHILTATATDVRQNQQFKKKIVEMLSKYEGARVCDASNDIIENLAMLIVGTNFNEGDESTQQVTSELAESSILQDVAGSYNPYRSSATQLHQSNACPYDMWPGHVHMDADSADMNDNSSQEGKVDLINCSEMHNGDLAEADQTCPADVANEHNQEDEGASEALPDVVDTDEPTPTEAEAEWVGLDRVPTRLHMEEPSEKQKD